MKNVNSLHVEIDNLIDGVMSGKVPLAKANFVANGFRTKINAVRASIGYAKARGEKPEILFMHTKKGR